ncbi:MAG: hypothetical protein ABEJ57_02880 [Halobacteriaceae archaeon]
MSTRSAAVWPKAHRVQDAEDRRYEATGLWTASLPAFVEGCAGDRSAHIERRGDRTFVVLD